MAIASSFVIAFALGPDGVPHEGCRTSINFAPVGGAHESKVFKDQAKDSELS